MVLARRLARVAEHCGDSYARFRVPGPPFSRATPADFKFSELLPLSTLARPRAAILSAASSELPSGVFSPWCCPALSIFILCRACLGP